jgi:hypothetical protein
VTELPPLATEAQYAAAHPGTAPENLADLLAAGSADIRRYCGWHIAPVIDDFRLLDGPGGRTVFLPTLKLRAVDAVNDDGTVLDTSTLEWSEDGMLRQRRNWTCRFRGVAVAFTHGFALEDVPGLTQLTIAIANRGTLDPTGLVASKSVGSVSVSYAPGTGSARTGPMDAEKSGTLDSYRLPVRL